MGETEKKVMELFKQSLEKKDEITSNLIEALNLELSKETPNAEKLAGIIKLKKEYMQDD